MAKVPAKRGKAKKYAGGGYVGDAGTNRGSWSGDGRSLGVRTGTGTGTSATNRPEAKDTMSRSQPKAVRPAKPMNPNAPKPKAKPGLSYSYKTNLAKGMSPGNYMSNPTSLPSGATRRKGR